MSQVTPTRSLFDSERVRNLPWHVLLPSLVSLVIGLWGLDRVGLWDDERQTLYAIPQLLWRLWEAPLIPYYATMWVWTAGGAFTGDYWLRLPSVLAMAGAVAFTASVGARVGGRRVGLLAGLILALMPAVTRYAQEVRVYAFATLLAAAATWLLVRAVHGSSRWWWAGYALSLAAIGVLAPFGYALIPAHAVLMFTDREWRPHVKPWLVACVANIPVALAAAFLSIHFGGAMHDWLAKPTPASFLTDVPTMPGTLAYGVALIALALVTRPGTRWLVALLAGMAGLWVVSQGPASFWLLRSFLPLTPLLAVAAGLVATRLGWGRLTAVVVLLALMAWPSFVAAREPGSRGLDPRQFAALVDSAAQPGDVINTAINDWFSWGVSRYSRHPQDYVYAPSSTGRAWVLDSDVPCRRLAEYSVPGGDSLLVLCESLPQGWENHVVRD